MSLPTRPRATLAFPALLLPVCALLCGCDAAPAPEPLSAEALGGSWTAELRHNGQSGRLTLAFEADDAGALAATAAIPAIEAWSVPAGAVELDPEAGTVAIATWVLDWDPEGPALVGTLPEGFVPRHAIEARFEQGDPVAPPATAAGGDAGAGPGGAPVVEPVWTHEAGAPIYGGIAFDADRVFVGDDAGVLRALDAATGRELWRFATGGAIRARPTVDGDALYVPSDDGLLYRLDATDGEERWKVRVVEGPVERGERFDEFAASATVAGDTLYLGTADGRVHALDLFDGSTRWTFGAGDAVASTPAVADGRVFVGSFDGHVHALDAATGEELWRHDTGGAVVSSAAAADGRVVIGSRSYDLLALDAATGRVDWTRYYWFSWVDSSPTIVGDTVYIGSSDALRLLAIDLASGEPRWTARTGGWSWAQPAVTEAAVYGGAVGVQPYIGERDGGFFAFARADGSMLWRFPVEPLEEPGRWGFASSPAVGNGLVFAGGLDGTVHAFPAADLDRR